MYHPIYNACKNADIEAITSITHEYYFDLNNGRPVMNHETFLWHAFDGAFKSDQVATVCYLIVHLKEVTPYDLSHIIMRSNVHTNAMREFAMSNAMYWMERSQYKEPYWYKFIEKLLMRFTYTNDEVFWRLLKRDSICDDELISDILTMAMKYECTLFTKMFMSEFEAHEHKGETKRRIHNTYSNLIFEHGQFDDALDDILRNKYNITYVVHKTLSNMSRTDDRTLSYHNNLRYLVKYLHELLQRMPRYLYQHQAATPRPHPDIVTESCRYGFCDILKTIDIPYFTPIHTYISAWLKVALKHDHGDIVTYIVTHLNITKQIIDSVLSKIREDTEYYPTLSRLYRLFPDSIILYYKEVRYILDCGICIKTGPEENLEYRDLIVNDKEQIGEYIKPIINTHFYDTCSLYDENLSSIIYSYFPYLEVFKYLVLPIIPVLEQIFAGQTYDKYPHSIIIDYLYYIAR